MSPTAIVGGALGLTTLIAAAAAWWQYSVANDERAARVEAEMAAAIAGVELADTLEKQSLAQGHADALAALRAEARAEIEDMINENNRLRAAREADMLARPFSAGTDIFVDLNRIMCRIEAAGGDGDPRSCDLSPAAAATAASPVVVVTPDVAEQWQERCDATGERDFCSYAIAGFTAAAMTDLRNWMLRMEEFTRQCRDSYDYYRAVIESGGGGD